ncbi:hypothetical protein D3C72_1802330 [compost metagenome]
MLQFGVQLTHILVRTLPLLGFLFKRLIGGLKGFGAPSHFAEHVVESIHQVAHFILGRLLHPQ